MRITVKDNTLIIAGAGPYYDAIRNKGGMRWDKTTQTLRGTVNRDVLEYLSRITILPADASQILSVMRETQKKTDAERMKEDPFPLFDYPVKVSLFKHQLRGANMAMTLFESGIYTGFGLLFEMGCGKTLTAIAVMGALYMRKNISKVLIVAPTSVCSVWPKELAEYADFPFAVSLMLGDKQKRLEAIKCLENIPSDNLKVAVINYESTHRDGINDALSDFAPDLIIADESQRIKSHSAAQSKAMHKLGDNAKYKLILSGTPVQNNVIDLYSQYRFMDPSVFGKNFYGFRSKYCRMGGYGNHQIIGYRDIDDLTRREHSVAYRVTKDECLDLPEQTFINRYVEFDASERRIYNELKLSGLAELESGESITAPTVLTKLLRLQQLTGGFLQTDGSDRPKKANCAKLEALEEIVDDYVIEGGKKLVVFARFLSEIKAIEEMLSRKKLQYGCIYGDVPISERGAIVEDFQKNDATKIFIAQLQTAGLGITLHAASAAVFYSIDFNYANYTQATARIHRIGQKNKCTYIHLLVSNTIDDKVLDAIKRKDDIAKTVVDSWRSYFE